MVSVEGEGEVATKLYEEMYMMRTFEIIRALERNVNAVKENVDEEENYDTFLFHS